MADGKVEMYCGRTKAKSFCREGQVVVLLVKQGGCSIIIWACFSYYGVVPIHWIKTNMDEHVYVDILQNVMLPYAEHEMPFVWVFQQDNDPKHTSKKAKKWFADNIIDSM